VQAYSGNSDETPRSGFVKLNTVPVWQASWRGTQPNLRGVTILLVDPFRCSVHESSRFDTYADTSAAAELSSYLQQVSRDYIIVGVTGDEPTLHLAESLPALKEIGADVADVEYRGSFGFVAQKGFPHETVLRKALTEADSKANQPHFIASVIGVNDCRRIIRYVYICTLT